MKHKQIAQVSPLTSILPVVTICVTVHVHNTLTPEALLSAKSQIPSAEASVMPTTQSTPPNREIK
jgi:hypothetical protein